MIGIAMCCRLSKPTHIDVTGLRKQTLDEAFSLALRLPLTAPAREHRHPGETSSDLASRRARAAYACPPASTSPPSHARASPRAREPASLRATDRTVGCLRERRR